MRTRPVALPAPTAPALSIPGRAWSIAAFAATLALATVLLVRLVAQASHVRFYTDECFHAYAAEWIARHGRLPVDFPEFYSGFYYYYPPLLHVIGAAWAAALGLASLPQLNVLLFALLLVTVACPVIPGTAAAPRRWAVLLLLASHWLALYAVRFYVEMLISLLALAAALLFVRFHRTARMRDAAWLGIATGLALVAKHTAIVLPAALAAFAVRAALARDRDRLRGYLLACAIALAISLPYFVRNALLFGSPFYPVFARETHALARQLDFRRPTMAMSTFCLEVLSAIGPAVIAMTAVAVLVAVRRRRWMLPVGVMLGGLAMIAVRFASSLFEVRHTMPLVPLLALAGSVVVWTELERRPRLAWLIEATLLVLAVIAVMRLGDLRAGVTVPPRLEAAYAAVRERVPEDATILSVWTYDTFYYTRRRATWPVRWSKREDLVELFYERDPDRFEALLRRFGIGYMLVPKMRPPPGFNGVNYPQSFIDCVEVLGRRGSLTILWESETLFLIAVTNPKAADTR